MCFLTELRACVRPERKTYALDEFVAYVLAECEASDLGAFAMAELSTCFLTKHWTYVLADL